MSQDYDHKKIETKWQKEWAKKKVYKTLDSGDKPKFYVLDMFPYPSGEGLHVGHPKGYIATDILSRMKRMQGHNVLHPMGFDAFGLPAENYAIKMKTNPSIAVAKNVLRYKRQLEILGFDYDWAREVNTTDPKYYKWTQWIFLKLLEKGLAYESYEPINWCPSCKTGLANEDVEDGHCERCGSVVEKKPMRQWVLKITDYADRLLADLDTLDWPAHIKESQRNWIGRSEGAEIDFTLKGRAEKIRVFTTRPDTLFGVTYVVLAPEHELVTKLLKDVKNKDEVVKYVAHARMMTAIERTDAKKDKTGVRLDGVMAINPVNKEEVPVYVADYVLADYGTGAVMAVPAHDDRDLAFQRKYNLGIRRVIADPNGISGLKDFKIYEQTTLQAMKESGVAWTYEGILMNSSKFDGRKSEEVRKEITAFAGGNWVTRYKLKDWVFSRQRYWGEPFPVLHGLKAKRALLIHGFEGSGTGHWFKKMKKALEERGVEVFSPTISTSYHPTIESWLAELSPLVKDFGPDDIIIGHSLGSNAALQLVQREKRNIGQLFLVASAIGKLRDEKFWDMIREMDGPESDVDALRKFWESSLDYIAISKWAPHVTLMRSKGDVVIPPITHEKLPASWRVIEIDGFGHFDSKTGTEFGVLWRELFDASAKEALPVAEKDLPVILPKVKSYEPSGTGESPLATIDKWVNVKIGRGKTAKILKRETNTMPQWAGSSWYYLRYMDPANSKALVDSKKEKYWNQVDFYVGGAEHATRHLIYARFWHKFLYDIGVVSTTEPFKKLQSVGLIMGEDGKKMSKRFGNVVNPDDIISTYGADTLRVYEMFMGPFDQAINWSTDSMIGSRRFIERVWKLGGRVDEIASESKATISLMHRTIAKVTDDISNVRLNTAVSALMTLANALEKEPSITRATYETYLRLLAPFAPHVAEEIWKNLKNKSSIHLAPWPVVDTFLMQDDEVTIVVQVNGKMRADFKVARTATRESIEAEARSLESVQKWIAGKEVIKTIVVPGKLVSFVVKG
jgi:leucyl-tRNA synthetase/predicted alpha/beta hydrolase family esterase